jgi:hypothetical protein
MLHRHRPGIGPVEGPTEGSRLGTAVVKCVWMIRDLEGGVYAVPTAPFLRATCEGHMPVFPSAIPVCTMYHMARDSCCYHLGWGGFQPPQQLQLSLRPKLDWRLCVCPAIVMYQSNSSSSWLGIVCATLKVAPGCEFNP